MDATELVALHPQDAAEYLAGLDEIERASLMDEYIRLTGESREHVLGLIQHIEPYLAKTVGAPPVLSLNGAKVLHSLGWGPHFRPGGGVRVEFSGDGTFCLFRPGAFFGENKILYASAGALVLRMWTESVGSGEGLSEAGLVRLARLKECFRRLS